jgi:hypothetical protein
MATTVRRKRTRVSDITQDILMYLTDRLEAAKRSRSVEARKKNLKPFVAENGVLDPETGHVNYRFETPLLGQYYGLQLRHMTGPEYLDEDEVLEFIRTWYPQLEKDIFPKQPVFQQDKLYAAVAEGKIDEDAVRGLIHPGKDLTPQLWPIEEDETEAE